MDNFEDKQSISETKVACIQFEPIIGEVNVNLRAIDKRVRAAAAEGASVVVLPELADTGYVFSDAAELAELAAEIPTGRSATFLCALSQELGIVIVCGLAERDAALFYNSAIICGPDGYIGKYRKLHLWNRENLFFQPGNLGLPVFDTPVGKIGIAVCYDGWFPETFRRLTLDGAQLICVPTNWVPMPGNEQQAQAMANILHKAAAHSNGVYIACADRIGTERGQAFIGQSLIIGPQGWPLAGPASAENDEIIFATVSLADLDRNRKLNEFNSILGDRRSDIYG